VTDAVLVGALVICALAAVGLGVIGARRREQLRAADERELALTQRVDALEREVHEARAVVAELDPPSDAVDDPDDQLADLEDDAGRLTDDATGLFNEQFFRVSLDTRVSAARRHLRPVAVVLVQVSQGVREGSPEPVDPDVVAEGVRATLRDADTACRLDDGRFALILEDTPENGAVWTVERVRRALAIVKPGQTLWAGIACYPAHAFDAWELFDRASKALEAAREWHQDRIEVATSD
jgi:GGDEF domain-containing protein